jgi:hypothetical protein
VNNDDNACESGIDNLFYSYADSLKNPKKISVEELKKINGFENISEESAHEIIDGMYKLTIITYKIFKNGIRTISAIH